ncbi:MAG: hypothetical protein PSV16_00645 [Flavobacterium sp.]|nr:hypothetical protein [Flavobacterium sp.]
MMRKILLFILAFICPLYVLAIEAGFKDYLKIEFPENASAISWSIFGFMSLAFYANFRITVLNPEERYEKAKIARAKYLRSYAVKVNEGLTSKDIPEFKFNVMIKRQSFFKRLYPKKNDTEGKARLDFFPKIFECIWTSEEDQHVDILLGVNQGNSGIALKEKRAKIVSLTGMLYEDAKNEMKLNKEQFDEVIIKDQIKQTSLAVLISTPIKVKVSTFFGDRSKVIAILNAECDDDGLGNLMSDKLTFSTAELETIKTVKIQLLKMMDEFTKTCSDLYF